MFCFASNAVLICAEVDGLLLLLLGALNVKVACFVSICVCKLPNVFVTFVAKFAELSKAAANSFNVSNAAGAPLIKSTPFIRIEVVSIILKLASLAERSPWTLIMFKETSVVSSICVPELDGALTNSIAVPPEFTAKNLLAVKDEGVSVKLTNVLEPPPLNKLPFW